MCDKIALFCLFCLGFIGVGVMATSAPRTAPVRAQAGFSCSARQRDTDEIWRYRREYDRATEDRQIDIERYLQEKCAGVNVARLPQSSRWFLNRVLPIQRNKENERAAHVRNIQIQSGDPNARANAGY